MGSKLSFRALLCLTLYRICFAQVIQCPDKVEVAEDDGSVMVCADLSSVSGTWDVETADGSAIAAMDYQRTRRTPEFNPSGSTETVCIDVLIIDDDEYEGRENFSVVFTLVGSGDSCTSPVEITDFEDLQDCRSPTMMDFAEGDGTVEVCATLIGNDIGGFVVEDGTATGGGVDYSASTGQSIRNDSDGIESCIIVNITDDSEVENPENFTVRFRQGFSNGRATCAETVLVRILDNDGPPTTMPTITTTPPPLSGAHCSEEEYVFLTEGGTLATPARVCMSFNGEMPKVDRIAIVTEDGEVRISSMPLMGMDPGELCVEIEELPDSIPEFNVTFFLAEISNVHCPVKIIDKADVPSIECEQLHYAVRENRSVVVCGLINDTTGELPPTGKIIATLMNEDGAELAGEMYELEIQSPQRYCTQLSIEDDLVPEPPTIYTIRLEWGGPTPNIAPRPGTCDLVVVDNDDIYSICFPNPPFPLKSFLFLTYNEFPFCLATLDVEPVLSEECEQTERICSQLSDTNIDRLPLDQQLMIARRSFGSDLEMACVEEIHSFVQDLYLVNISSPPEETCTADCALYTGGVDGCSEGVLVLHNVDGPSALDTDREPFVLENCPTDLMFHFSCCQSEVPNFCYDGSEPTTSAPEPTTTPTEPALEPPTSSSQSSNTGPVVGAGVVGVVVFFLLLLIVIVVICICWRRSRRRRSQYKARNGNTERSTVEGAIGNPNYTNDEVIELRPNGVAIEVEPTYAEITQHLTRKGKVPVGSSEKWKEVFAGLIVDPSQVEIEKPLNEGAFGKVFKGRLVTTSPPHSAVGYTTVAVKTLKKVSSGAEVEDFIAESAIMLQFNHPNILRLVGVCFDTEDGMPLIILPFMANGDLRSFLKAKKPKKNSPMEGAFPEVDLALRPSHPEGLSEGILLGMCLDIAKGMEYLARCKFVHRDLAARNCMVDDKLVIKVADFGMSRDVYHSDIYRLTHRARLPVKWMPPESFFHSLYSEKTDVWSFGVVCWEIFSLGAKPFRGIENPDIPERISNGERLQKPSLSSGEMYELMHQTWSEDPEGRPSFAQLVHMLMQQLPRDTSTDHQYWVLERQRHTPDNTYGDPSHPYFVLEGPTNTAAMKQDSNTTYVNMAQNDASTAEQRYVNMVQQDENDFPEEYEVPIPINTFTRQLENATPASEYEVPMPNNNAAGNTANEPHMYHVLEPSL